MFVLTLVGIVYFAVMMERLSAGCWKTWLGMMLVGWAVLSVLL